MYLTYSICLSGIQEESNAELQILTEVIQIKSNTKGLRILKGQFQAISCLTVTLSRRLLVILNPVGLGESVMTTILSYTP